MPLFAFLLALFALFAFLRTSGCSRLVKLSITFVVMLFFTLLSQLQLPTGFSIDYELDAMALLLFLPFLLMTLTRMYMVAYMPLPQTPDPPLKAACGTADAPCLLPAPREPHDPETPHSSTHSPQDIPASEQSGNNNLDLALPASSEVPDYPTWLSMPGSFPQDMPTLTVPVDDNSTPDLTQLPESKQPLVPSGQDESPQITIIRPPRITNPDGSELEWHATPPSDSNTKNKAEDAGVTELTPAERDMIVVDVKVSVELKKTINDNKTAPSPAPDPADVFRSALIDAGCDEKKADEYVAEWQRYRTDRQKDRLWTNKIEFVKRQAALPKEEDDAKQGPDESLPQSTRDVQPVESLPRSPTNVQSVESLLQLTTEVQPVESPPFFFPGPARGTPFDDEDESAETADAIDARGLANADAEPASAPCKHYDYILMPKKMQSLILGPSSASKASPATSQLDVMFPVEKLTEMEWALVAASEAKHAAVSAPVTPVAPVVDTPAPLTAPESGDDVSCGPYIVALSPVQEVGEPSKVDEGTVFEVPEKIDAVVVPASEAPIEDVAEGLDSSAGKLDVHLSPLNDSTEAKRVDSKPTPVVSAPGDAKPAERLDSSAGKLDVHIPPLNDSTEDKRAVSKPAAVISAPGNAQPAESEPESMTYEPTGAPAVVPNPIPELVDDGVANEDLGELPDGGDGDDPLAAFVGNQSDSDDDMSDDESDLSSIFDDEKMQESDDSSDLLPPKDTEATMEDALPDKFNFNFVGHDSMANLPDSTMDDVPLAKDDSQQPFKFQLAPDLFSNLQKPQVPSVVAKDGSPQPFKSQLGPDFFSNLQKSQAPSVVANPEQQNADDGSTAGEKTPPVASQAELSDILERIRADNRRKQHLDDSSTSEAKKESPLADQVHEHKPLPQELPTAPILPKLDESKDKSALKRASAKDTSISETTRKKPLVESTEKGPSQPQESEPPKTDWPADYGTRFANGPPAHVKVGGVSPASSFGHSTILPASGMTASPQSSVAPPPVMPNSGRYINESDFFPSSSVTPLPQLSQGEAESLIVQWMERTEKYVKFLDEKESKMDLEEFLKFITGPKADFQLDAIIHRMQQILEFATNGTMIWKNWDYNKVPPGLTKDIIDDIAHARNRLHSLGYLHEDDDNLRIMKAAKECKRLVNVANKKAGRKPIVWE